MSTQRELLVLNEGTPQIVAAQVGADTYLAPVTLNDATGNEVAFEVNYTVNKATSGDDTGLLVNQTDTASPGTSLLADFQVGGTSKFAIDNSAQLFLSGSGNAAKFYMPTILNFAFNTGFVDKAGVVDGVFSVRSAGEFTFSSTSTFSGTPDVRLARDAANTLAQRNGANAQTFNLYHTWTDASNYERTTWDEDGVHGNVAGTGSINNVTQFFGVKSGASWTGIQAAFASNALHLYKNSSAIWATFQAVGQRMLSGVQYLWSSSASDANVAADTGLARDSAAVVRVTDGSTGTGGLIAGGTLTAASGTDYAVQITPTYNQSSTAGSTDLLVNRTETAVGSGEHLLADFQVGGTSKFYVDNAGNTLIPSGSNHYFASTNWGISYNAGVNGLLFTAVGSKAGIVTDAVRLLNTMSLTWGTALNAAGDVILARDAANTLAQRNGTNAQTFRAYGTFTDLSNYERLAVGHDGTDGFINVEAAGTGTAESLKLQGVTNASSSGTFTAVEITPTYNQSGTAGGTDLLVNRTETAVGSGEHLLADFQVGGVSQLKISNTGLVNGTYFVQDATNKNYGVGSEALDSLTVGSGIQNVAFGGRAGTAVSTGDNNTFVGDDAGAAIAAQSGNTFVGKSAGEAATTSNFTAIGYLAGSNSAGASEGAVVGYLCGQDATGDGLTALGWSAATVVTGIYNTFVGWSAGQDFSSGANCVGIGGQALADGSGDDCTAVGRNALRNSTGSDNTALGYQAGDLITSGQNNICIGHNVDPDAATDNHSLHIGDAINGFMSALTDVDYSGKNLTVSGPSALASAVTNQDGGDLILQGGQKASGGGTSGDVLINSEVYGHFYEYGSANSITVTTAGTYYGWTTVAGSKVSGMTADTADATADHFTITHAGEYHITGAFSFNAGANDQVQGAIHVGGTINADCPRFSRTMGSSAVLGVATIDGVVTLAASDEVSLRFTSNTNGDVIDIEDFSLTIKRVGS